jgi:hypothetical protein
MRFGPLKANEGKGQGARRKELSAEGQKEKVKKKQAGREEGLILIQGEKKGKIERSLTKKRVEIEDRNKSGEPGAELRLIEFFK